ncbi:YqcI/YcgG family protein [Sphaerisporangium sp. B11E5]|uniref:YqcI/YcgG family protein n=1 Tax=Sphaerisporangium sp. B11E5 TaxID=3153563 RepID=UPI00325E326D
MTHDAPPGAVTSRDWLPGAVAAFEHRLSDDAYPCHFGVRAHRDRHNTYAALDRRDPGAVPALAAALEDFQVRARTGPVHQSLVVLDGPPLPSTLDEDRTRFWDLLAGLAPLDRAPWPGDVPDDPGHPRWQWCFGGEPWFVFAMSPGYDRRASRWAPCLTMVFQTRRVFTGLSGTNAAGQGAKRLIRDRMRTYDTVPPHPHLGDAGGSSTHKWRQYFLPDDQSLLPEDGCPFPGHRTDTTGEPS